MQKSIFALAMTCVAASNACAQSSMAIYGTVDVSLRRVNNNAGSILSLSNGSLSSSRLGFRGTEDLGGGLSANFALEADVFVDTGQTGGNTITPVPQGQFWSRQSWVGLRSASLGELRFGRDYTPPFLTVATYDPFGYVGVGALTNLFTSTQIAAVNAAFGPATTSYNTLVRTSNSITYYTPATLGGFFASAQAAFGEGGTTGPTGNSKFLGARVGYAKGPILIEAAYSETKNTAIAGQSFKEAAAGASYDFGRAKLMGGYTQLKYATAKAAVYTVSASGPAGAAGLWKLSYARVNQSGAAALTLAGTPAGGSIDDRDASQLAAGYAYNLSKRTALYTQIARVTNKGVNAGFTVAGGPPLVAGVNRKSTGFEVGIKHSF